MWGTRCLDSCRCRKSRFIPTGVGNTLGLGVLRQRTAVHPHGCGEHHAVLGDLGCALGSSPRVWGTLSCRFFNGVLRRFIPTGVGNTATCSTNQDPSPVHPHGCGEHRCDELQPFRRTGSSPRVWGTSCFSVCCLL